MITFNIQTLINISKVKPWEILGKPSGTHELLSSSSYSSITSGYDGLIPDRRREFPGMTSIGKRVIKWLEGKDNPDDIAKIHSTQVEPASTSCLVSYKGEHTISKIVSHMEYIYAKEKKRIF